MPRRCHTADCATALASAVKTVGVFCGSSVGGQPAYAQAAERLGRALAARGLGLVYGGASVGLMGVLADTVLQAGGAVVGVMPRGLARREITHGALTELVLVDSLSARKQLMVARADAFVTLPGGFGTLDELAEVLTMAQLGQAPKPCGLLEVEGFFAPLLAFLDGAVRARFLRPQHRALLLVDDDPDRLLDTLAQQPPAPAVGKWIDRG